MLKIVWQFILLIVCCLFLANCTLFRSKNTDELNVTRQYDRILADRYGIKNTKVWTAHDSNYVAIRFVGNGIPIRALDTAYSIVDADNIVELAELFLKANEDIFATAGSTFILESDSRKFIQGYTPPWDSLPRNWNLRLTQIFKGVPVNPEETGDSRSVYPGSGNVDIFFSDSTILAVNCGTVRNINLDEKPQISREMAIEIVRDRNTKSMQDTVSNNIFAGTRWYDSSLSFDSIGSCRLVVITNDELQKPCLVWKIIVQDRGLWNSFRSCLSNPICIDLVDAHTGEIKYTTIECQTR